MLAPVPNQQADAQRLFTTLKGGGIALCPTDVGYSLLAATPSGIEKIFMTKQRTAAKRHPMMGSYSLHKELHVLSFERAEIVRVITQELKLPLAVVAKYDPEHRVIKTLSNEGLEASTANGTVVLMMGTGGVGEELTKLCEAEGLVLQGSSANPSGTGDFFSSNLRNSKLNEQGNKFTLESVPQEIRQIADIELDYGLTKYWFYGRASTMIDFSKGELEVVRIGVCYEVIKDVLKRFWEVELPEDPGREALPFGNLKQLPPSESLSKLIEKTSHVKS